MDLDKPAEGLGTTHGEGFNAVFCDGARRLLKKDLDPQVLQLLFMRDDGKPVPEF